jgi:hypothetical protein
LFNAREVVSRLRLVRGMITVTAHLALILSFTADLAVMVVVPTLIAVIVPPETVATALLLLDQSRPVSVVSVGLYVTVRGEVSPTPKVRVEGRLIPIRDTITVTVQLTLKLLFAVDVAVMVAVPPPIAVTVPPETVATALLLLDQATPVSVVLAGV